MNLKKIFLNFMDNFENYSAQILLAFFVMLLFLQVVLRMFWGLTLSWSEELSRFAFVWFVFLGASHGARVCAHSRVSAQFKFMSKKKRDIILGASDLVWIFFNLVMAWKGIVTVVDMVEFPYVSPTLGWSMAYIYLVIPLCFITMTIRIIQVNYMKFVLKIDIETIE